jgi:serine/threonine protein kinase
VLFRGIHKRTGREAMVEVVRSDPDLLAQIAGEQRAAELVSHRGIVELLDRGASPTEAWVVTESLSGQSLARRLTRCKKLSADEIATIFAQLIDIVAHIQRAGVTHTGIDARQVILQTSAADRMRVRLLDFGVVRKGDKLFGSFAPTSKAEAEAVAARTPKLASGLNVDIAAIGKLLEHCLTRVRMPRALLAREHQYLRIAKLCQSAKQPKTCEDLTRLWALSIIQVDLKLNRPHLWQRLLWPSLVLVALALGWVLRDVLLKGT